MTPLVAAETFIESDLEPYIGYIRVSTWKEEKISPEIQQAAILEWASRNRKRIVRWITDLDMTGRNFKRKIMQGIEAIERAEAKGIAVWKFSRFGRSRDGVAVNLKRVENTGGELVSATEPIDARTAIGRLYRGIIFEFSAYESDRAGEQWAETHDLRRSMGLPATGRERFGYTWHRRYDPKTEKVQQEFYEPKLDIGPIVVDLYLMYVAGSKGFAKLCGWLNAQGFRTTRGSLWSTPTLTRYMDSGFAAGLLRVHNRDCKCNGSCPNYQFVEGAHEELIGPDIWQQYVERRKLIKDTAPRSRQGSYMLTGTMNCGGCRRSAGVNAAQRKGKNIRGYAYRCGTRAQRGQLACAGCYILRSEVEGEVTAFLRQHADGIDESPSVQVRQTRDFEAAQKRTSLARKELEKQHKRLTTALTNLAVDKSLNPENYEDDVYEKAKAKLTDERARITKQLEAATVEAAQPTFTELRPIVVGLMAEWETLLVSERNAIIRKLIRRVALTKNESGEVVVEIHPLWMPDPWASKAAGHELAA
ncbi:recombinase family protein [Streptomyces sp. MJM8645]|uniref:recombinase family protein n=1 Tax=Streptomycetaceae TaxID=2062 RepID=UPI0007AFD431|nr:recombinase family protein [Streptomyces sp. MJM8645]